MQNNNINKNTNLFSVKGDCSVQFKSSNFYAQPQLLCIRTYNPSSYVA